MPIEQIKRIQEEARVREALARQQEALARQLEQQEQNRQRIEEQNLKLAAEQKLIEREKFIQTKTEQIFRESGALAGLKRIENELLAWHVRKHDLVVNLSEAKATLVWGNRYSASEADPTGHESVGLIFKHQVVDCSFIVIKADVDTNSLTIDGNDKTTLYQATWQIKDKVDEALAQAYLNPKHLNHDTNDDYTSSSSSYNSECCNGNG